MLELAVDGFITTHRTMGEIESRLKKESISSHLPM
jgi:hypothetical protein